MQRLGLEALDVYSVDNILARVADPEYIGCCYSAGSQLGCRVVAKAYPEEKVGVFATNSSGGLQVRTGLPAEAECFRDQGVACCCWRISTGKPLLARAGGEKSELAQRILSDCSARCCNLKDTSALLAGDGCARMAGTD